MGRYGSPSGSVVKNLLQCRICSRCVYDPWWGRSPEEEMAVHSSNLAGTVPWIEEPGGLQSIGLQRVGHDRAAEHSQHSHIPTEYIPAGLKITQSVLEY